MVAQALQKLIVLSVKFGKYKLQGKSASDRLTLFLHSQEAIAEIETEFACCCRHLEPRVCVDVTDTTVQMVFTVRSY